MAWVQVNSNMKTGVVWKLAIELRRPFKVTTYHGNMSYTVNPFNKPDGVHHKCFAHDMYTLPPQNLPCDQIDLQYLQYMSTIFVPAAHIFKYGLNIERYNSVLFNSNHHQQSQRFKKDVATIWHSMLKDLQILIKLPSHTSYTIEEMDTSLKCN